jgi:hypothetical protein
VLEEFLKFDSKVALSFWLLLARPGFLTMEFLGGRRVRYLSPFKLYFTVSFLFFFLFGLMGWDRIFSKELGERQAERMLDWLNANVGLVTFLALPWGAWLLKGLHRNRLYMEHLVFATHGHSLTLLAAAPTLFARQDWVDLPLVLVVLFWWQMALRRVYGTSVWKTAGHVALLGLGYLVFALLAALAITALALR